MHLAATKKSYPAVHAAVPPAPAGSAIWEPQKARRPNRLDHADPSAAAGLKVNFDISQ